MREGIDLDILSRVSVDAAQASEGVLPVYVHRTRATNAFSARAAERQSGIDFILDLDECIQNLTILRNERGVK